jgi:hypothetical protein
MVDTRHLDTAIAIFNGRAKRPARKAQVEIHVLSHKGRYSIQLNGKPLVVDALGDTLTALSDAEQRANTIRALGKTVVIHVY